MDGDLEEANQDGMGGGEAIKAVFFEEEEE